MQIELAYGKTGLMIDVPDEATVLEPSFIPGLEDEQASILAALRDPIGSDPLAALVNPGQTVAIVFSDITRPMPNDRVLPVLLEELNRAGMPDANVTLINALGTHRVQTPDELVQMLGPHIPKCYNIIQHDAWDEASLVAVGTNALGNTVKVNKAYMDADLRILTGFVEPHFFAGFSGGPKAVLPGIADINAILDNHGAKLLSSPMTTWATTMGNPLWEEIRDIALKTQPDFLLNVTLNRDKAITGVFAGSLLDAHEKATQFVQKHAMQGVDAPFDVVITSNSGYPLDLNLYQAVKGMSAAVQIVKPGGDIIIAAECWDGLPAHGEYGRLLKEASGPEDMLATIMMPGFRCHDQWEAQVQAQIQMKATVHVYADGLSDDELRDAMVEPCNDINTLLEEILISNPAARVAVLPQGPQTVPFVS